MANVGSSLTGAGRSTPDAGETSFKRENWTPEAGAP
jgi:hypothetical protein